MNFNLKLAGTGLETDDPRFRNLLHGVESTPMSNTRDSPG